MPNLHKAFPKGEVVTLDAFGDMSFIVIESSIDGVEIMDEDGNVFEIEEAK